MKYVVGLTALAFLASCGVDGAPLQPTANAGISIGTGGVKTSASVGAKKGPVSIKVGL